MIEEIDENHKNSLKKNTCANMALIYRGLPEKDAWLYCCDNKIIDDDHICALDIYAVSGADWTLKGEESVKEFCEHCPMEYTLQEAEAKAKILYKYVRKFWKTV